ncbi:hypothetical protein F5Y18DRAFT_381804 [Xylariaceae sp. FL1019]|nr:hypothetical protein F5Y18DRAFT_381804 [Xylariaceae sp. FL1019]
MAFFEDPRLRQRWNRISQTTETVTESAAAGIWSLGHNYITPCLGSVGSAFDSCTGVCLGDREERARRARERQRTRGRAEFSFDFYDDWDEEFGEHDGGGLLGGWRGEDWDRLVGGSGKRAGEVTDQPRTRNRAMSYGTRGTRRRASIHEDPTVIPSTSALGFLGRLPFKIGGTLRYKPSAADLQEHPGFMKHVSDSERAPLLGSSDDDLEIHPQIVPTQPRKRSATISSGGTSDSYRSRGDLFPSDEEGEEDAVPLDDEFTIALDHHDDRSSNRTKSSKGKRTAQYRISRSESRTTMDSTRPSIQLDRRSTSDPASPVILPPPSLEDLEREELQLELEEQGELEKNRQSAAELALHRGLSLENLQIEAVPDMKSEFVEITDVPAPQSAILDDVRNLTTTDAETAVSTEMATADAQGEPRPSTSSSSQAPTKDDFVPARLPQFR